MSRKLRKRNRRQATAVQPNKRRPTVDPGFKPVSLEPRTEGQKEYIAAIRRNSITFCTGPAGTGKTHVAIGAAVKAMRSEWVDRIIITRPLVSVGKDMGFLPGGVEDKVGPYVRPCFDELNYYLSLSVIGQWMRDRKIEIVPLSMMRGRTFNSAFVILDEAQNALRPELKTLLTRLGQDCRMVLTGDLAQSDLSASEQGALNDAISRLRDVHSIEHVELGARDIVRNKLIHQIINKLW